MTDDSKLDKAKLAPIFEGELNREAMAAALNTAMQEQNLSTFRKAAAAANVDKNDIRRICSSEASLDKAAEVLNNLGYEVHIEIRRNDHS